MSVLQEAFFHAYCSVFGILIFSPTIHIRMHLINVIAQFLLLEGLIVGVC